LYELNNHVHTKVSNSAIQIALKPSLYSGKKN